ncbi:LysR substrate-binding domain-containing protein [Actinacidiphila sp. ITFR-21]|uniref:LysR substrate-binding domain-containing protein n=1 Tax=Actinacidiphila sp. ITFR-21 TaxID=3075199 RepID=UPI00288B15C2|nr:LysR substrate-binding domain-containing protein [Streptomyces sp. ITFR-21]WNI14253.1 LysR substrate-binding domain-containing protein [Streptomyces sp. ITFR-21]
MPSRDDISTDDLRLLLALARTGKLVAAAAIVGIDHTTVRRRLRRLESSLGVTLIEHGSDGWVLTELGRVVVERSNRLEDVVHDVRAAVQGVEGTVRGTVRIAAPDGFGASLACSAIAEVVREHPGITVELVTSTRPLSPRAAGYDLSVSIGEPRQGWLASELLTRYELGLYTSHDYLRRHGPLRSTADLANHRLVFYVDSHLAVAELDLARSFAGMGVGFASTSVHAQLAATRDGAGIGLLPSFLAEPEPELRRVLPAEVRFVLAYSLSLRRDSPAPDAVELIRTALHRHVAGHQRELLPLA